ncbi:hypothetical protein [Phenylobacterium sp.]|uniref:hypothetical protein n=1 Tax=Phenylobacterium sp. TaxID=1871053 RepID=UPI003001473F
MTPADTNKPWTAGLSWEARFTSYSQGWTVYGRDENGEYLVAESIGPYADDDEEEARAEREANLLAAAPDMAEALADARRLLIQADPDLIDSACVAKIDAALQKARGGES